MSEELALPEVVQPSQVIFRIEHWSNERGALIEEFIPLWPVPEGVNWVRFIGHGTLNTARGPMQVKFPINVKLPPPEAGQAYPADDLQKAFAMIDQAFAEWIEETKRAAAKQQIIQGATMPLPPGRNGGDKMRPWRR